MKIQETRIVSFILPEHANSRMAASLEIAVKQFPNAIYEKKQTSQSFTAEDESQDILIITINQKEKKIVIGMKGQRLDWQL